MPLEAHEEPDGACRKVGQRVRVIQSDGREGGQHLLPERARQERIVGLRQRLQNHWAELEGGGPDAPLLRSASLHARFGTSTIRAKRHNPWLRGFSTPSLSGTERPALHAMALTLAGDAGRGEVERRSLRRWRSPHGVSGLASGRRWR